MSGRGTAKSGESKEEVGLKHDPTQTRTRKGHDISCPYTTWEVALVGPEDVELFFDVGGDGEN